MKANLATSLIAYARGGVRKQLLVLCLLTLCAGNMWGGTKRIYCEYSGVSSWWSTIYVYAWGGEHDAKKYTMTATGTSNLVYCDIDDYHTDLLFFKSNSQTGSWDTQSVDVSISSNNRWSLGDGGWGNKGTISNPQRYAPGTAIDGLVDIKNPHNQMFTDGTYSTTLEAHKTYEFKILETSTLYGLNDLIATSSISNQTLNTSGYQVRLCTAGAGTYTFAYNSSTHTLSITYPETSHPSIDYCYVIDYSWSPSANLHLWNGTSTKVAEWNGGSTIAGSTWPGAAISNKTTIGGQSYFYIAPGEYANFLVSKSGDETDRSGDLTTSDGYGKRRYWKDETDGWIWDTFTVCIQLENDGADAGHKGTEYQDVAFNSDVLSDITCPEKTHYDFGGYWTEVGGTGTQVIDKHGHWIASVSDAAGVPYTDASKHWIHPGTSTTLYAKWTEHGYAITIAVEGSGTTSPASSTIGKIKTPSGDITATPGTGYSFREWDFSKQGESDYDVWCAGGYNSYDATIRISAKRVGTLTAKFTANNYNVNLENLGADEGYKGTENVSVTYNSSANLIENITIPKKAHYDFGGYYTSSDEGVTLDVPLIDENGAWIADVSSYTNASKQWIYAGDITLYAKWTETAYTITPSVSPAGAGSVNTVTDAHLITPSSTITATPANAAWTFDYWEYGEHVGCASGSGNAITVTASQNSTITAHFKPRFSLVGSLYEGDEGGMPGWEDYTKTFTVNNSSPVDLTRTCTLQANSTYKVQVHDNATGTNLGRSGCDPVCVLEENASLVMENSDIDVFLYTSGAGEYIFKITAVDGSGHPTLTVLRPYPVNFGQKYLDIDGALHTGTTGGSATATAGGNALTSGDYVTYNTSVTHTATPAGGYTFVGWWSSDAFEGDAFSNTNPMTYAVTSGDNAYAKFVETFTSVTLANDGHGKVQIGGVDTTSTTCGVTTTRELTAVPNEGYKFSSWSKSGDDITLSSSSTNPTTLSGNGSGATSGQTVTANFEERYSIKGTMNGENWGTTHTLSNIGTNAGSKDTCYVTMTLPANTTYEFAIYDEQTGGWYKAGTDAVYGMTYTNHTNWEFGDTKTYNCGITTAGKGTYKFIFNITDKTVTVVYPTSYQVNYDAAVGGSVTSVKDGDNNDVPNGGYVCEGGSVTYEATANEGYTFTGWCPNDSYGDTFTDHNPWENSNVTATSNAYAKFHSTNFVIYRKDDKESDPRAVWDDVESYKGGTISETIEFRMKVNKLDYWYTLCLPFEVNAVQVWEDGAYYDIVPYWRPTDSTYCTGHYILRRPVTTTNFAIEGFEGKDRWIDPKSSDVLPSKNIPYIIQWHDRYFQDKYISFFGNAGQTIPIAMDKGSYASSDETVNIYGNNSMTTGMVRDAYLLDPYYGTNGAWMREELGTDRSVLPFECFILANPATTAKYRVLRRDMADDTPTGLDTLSKTEDTVSKVLIDNHIYIIRGGKMYTIQGTFVKEVE